MKRWKMAVLFAVLSLTIIPLFQNCGVPQGLDTGETVKTSTRDNTGSSTTPFQPVVETDPYTPASTTPIAKANDATGTISLPADAQVVWEWSMPSEVTRAHSRMYNCPNTQYNQEADFDWANGLRSGRVRGTSFSIGRAGCTHEVCFYTASQQACVTVNYVNPYAGGYARANGQSGFVSRRADERVEWQWKLATPVTDGQSQHTDCKDPSRNTDLVHFDFANGTTESTYLGSSNDYRRDGCRHKVCFTAGGESQCVTVDYTMSGGTYFAKANGSAGVVRAPANQKVLWSFKTETPVVRATAQVTQCNDSSRNMALTEFTWANGLTEKTELGSSEDAGRVGCNHEVCFHTASKSQCVLVIYQ